MNATFYNNASDPRTINKNISSVVSYSALQWKSDTSILNPSFITGYDVKLLTANYVYVSTLSRYYFIVDITVLAAKQILIQCKCDVLQTYRTQILALPVIVKRQENKYNLYMDDDKFIVKNTRQMVSKQINSSAFSPSTANSGTANFVLSIAGGGA